MTNEEAPSLVIAHFHPSTSTQNLEAIVKDSAPELVDVLQNPAVVRAFSLGSETLIRFLIGHIRELLELAFVDDCERVTICAFKILALGNPLLLPFLLRRARFGEFALELLSLPRERLSHRLISRLSAITLTVLCCDFDDNLSYCGYLFHLLRYCDNLGVFSLFCTISESDVLDKAQKWLIEIGYADYIVRELGTVVSEGETERVMALLRLIAETSSSSKVMKAFQSKTMMEALSVDVNLSWQFENARWNAICAICGDSWHDQCGMLLAVKAHQVLTTATDRIRECHAKCLSFLVQFLKTRTDLFDESLVQSVLGLMLQFMNCSFFHLEVRKFVVASLRVEVVRKRIIRLYIPVLVVETQIREHGVIPMIAYAILEDVWRNSKWNGGLRSDLAPFEEYHQFIEDKLKPYIALREANYGGETQPSFWDILMSARYFF